MEDRFGIDMKRFCRAHEARIQAALSGGLVSRELLDLHLEKLRWLQHERLVHLIVLALTALAELFSVEMTLIHPELGIGAAVAMLGLAVLLAFYFAHYFFLENTVQHWYNLAEKLMENSE